jgi:hypothetical protein
MKHVLVSAVTACALLGTVAQAAPAIGQASPMEADKSTYLQNVNWYGWHHRHWRHHYYWRHHHWHRW